MQSKGLLFYNSKQVQADRLNPQFIGIGKEYVQTHIKRKKVQKQAKQIVNNVSYLQKEENNTSRKLQKKQQEYETLMSIINRRQADNDKKEADRREREQMIMNQREKNIKMRLENQEKRRNAFLELHQKNYQNHDEMKNSFRKSQEMRKTFRIQELYHKKNLVQHISQQKQEGKRKVNYFYKQRNDSFTKQYKQKIKLEKQQQQHASQKILEMSNKKQQLKTIIQNKHSRLIELNDQIQSLSKIRKSRVQDNLGSFTWKNSSFKGSDDNGETKQESGLQIDRNIEGIIQKELNHDNSSINRL